MRLYWLIFSTVLTAAVVSAGVMVAASFSTTRGPLTLLTCALVALGLASALGVFLARRISQPLGHFGTFALQIAQGKFGAQVQHTAEDELGELAKTLNYMSASIEAYDAETQRLGEGIEAGYLETIVALANSIDSKDPYTRGHSQRVAEMSVELGKELGLSDHELKQLKYGGILHDIGKIGIIESILMKQSRLTDEEMVAMREHPMIGDRIIRPVSFLSQIRSAVRNHHERWDGQGYPDALKGEEIPLLARIVSCADTWDACTSTRPYSRALSEEEALKVIEKVVGTQIDPKVAQALRTVVGRRKKSTPSSETVKKAS